MAVEARNYYWGGRDAKGKANTNEGGGEGTEEVGTKVRSGGLGWGSCGGREPCLWWGSRGEGKHGVMVGYKNKTAVWVVEGGRECESGLGVVSFMRGSGACNEGWREGAFKAYKKYPTLLFPLLWFYNALNCFLGSPLFDLVFFPYHSEIATFTRVSAPTPRGQGSVWPPHRSDTFPNSYFMLAKVAWIPIAGQGLDCFLIVFGVFNLLEHPIVLFFYP